MGADVLPRGFFGLIALLCACVVAVEYDLFGLGRHLAPKYHAFFAVLPPAGRWIWRATVLSCVAQFALLGFAIAFHPDLWFPAVWLSGAISPWLVVGGAVSLFWAALCSARPRE
jgi:hypothetical protein